MNDKVKPTDDTPDEIEITVKLKKIRSPKWSKGSMHMKMADTCAEISSGDDKIGSVDGCMGGGTEVCLRLEGGFGLAYFLSVQSLWNAVMEATGKQDLMFDSPPPVAP